MKFITVLLSIVFFAVTIPTRAQHTLSLGEGGKSPKASIEELSWIAGHWKGEAFGGIVEEIWSPPMGGSMMAAFRLVNEGKVSFYEIEVILEVEETLVLRLKHFHHDLKGWEEKDDTVDFPLVKIAGNKAYFDGMTFDRISDTEMDIYVVIGSEEGDAKEMKFAYRLVE